MNSFWNDINISLLKWMYRSGIIMWMRPANERRRYIVTSSPIGLAHIQSDPWQIIWTHIWNHFCEPSIRRQFSVQEMTLVSWVGCHDWFDSTNRVLTSPGKLYNSFGTYAVRHIWFNLFYVMLQHTPLLPLPVHDDVMTWKDFRNAV